MVPCCTRDIVSKLLQLNSPMKVRVKVSRWEFLPVIQLLDIAIHDYTRYDDVALKIIVRDARLLAADKNKNLYIVDRGMLRYSRELSKLDRNKLMSMDYDNLQVEDYQYIYNFFKNRR